MGKRLSQLGQAEQVKKEDYLLVDGQNYLESKKIPFKDINLSNFNTDGFYNQNTVDSLLEQKQNSLVSGKTIKTINGLNLLGEGNITIATDADQTYSPTSENAQSGKAVAEAVSTKANIEFAPINITNATLLEGTDGVAIHTLSKIDSSVIDPSLGLYYYALAFDESLVIQLQATEQEFAKMGFVIGNKYRISVTSGNVDSIEKVTDLKDKVNIEDIDQTYSPESPNAQSGIAVKEATNFRLLCSTEVTQSAFDAANGEIKIISVGDENKTFDGVNQIRIFIYLPQSDTINTANSRLAIRATVNAGDSLAPDGTILLRGNGAGESITLLYNKSQYLSATLDFIDNKFVQGICVKNLYGSYTYGTSAYGWTNSPINMADKKYLHIRSHDNTFKFPVGTTVEVYGR